MRHLLRCLLLLTAIAGGANRLHAAAGRDDAHPSYTNVQVIAVDAIGRTLVVRNTKGVEEKMQLDDNLAGFADIKAGDRVILTLHTGPGWARVSSITKSRAVPAPKIAAGSSPSLPVEPVDTAQALDSRKAFDAQVASLAGQADRVDRVWNEFRRACNFEAVNPHEGARGWFAIWEGSIRADLSGGFCRDLFNQVVDLGVSVNAGMTSAEDVARRTLSPGDIREIRRQYRMDWDGWALTPPKRLEQ
jgi:hypothetical protein